RKSRVVPNEIRCDVMIHPVCIPVKKSGEIVAANFFVAEGEKVLVRLRVLGTHLGPFGDMAASGRKIDIGVLDLFQIRDGVMIEHWALLDNLGMLKQLGAIPA
ncbi:MAG: hypothetical protein EBX64_04895, partial [Betaproteobacteria bacterium]|nr:hypothetical protein [Betaproteobacteria bacterium]